jgi:predicted DNA-binding transcriptional regulator AlpA
MQKSQDLLDLKEVASYFGVSESTIRRKVKKRRENGCGFILPLFSQGSRLLWRKSDVLSWEGEGQEEVIMYTPSVPSLAPVQTKSHSQVQRELRALGVKLPGDE